MWKNEQVHFPNPRRFSKVRARPPRLPALEKSVGERGETVARETFAKERREREGAREMLARSVRDVRSARGSGWGRGRGRVSERARE